eukprot:gene10731-14415_t
MLFQSSLWLVFCLCAFIALLSFKPSEPYLSEYLICNKSTQQEYCESFTSTQDCSNNYNDGCVWSENKCSLSSCSSFNISSCNSYNYCIKSTSNPVQCEDSKCYENFSMNQVNNMIYPWSTYAYLPFLLLLGTFAELFSYQIAILIGISGRVVTRFLLLYGKSLIDMQLMQVVYSLGTAAEDVFSAYVYYVIPHAHYQLATSSIKAAALVASVLAGITGDILVIEGNVSLKVLMIISAAFVCAGFVLGLFVI